MKLNKKLKAARALLAADEQAYHALEPHTGKWPVRIISGVGQLGDQPPLRSAAGAIGVLGVLSGDKRLMRAGARMFLSHELATVLKNLVKNRLDRHRPEAARRRGDRKPRKGKNTAKAVSSFPSGHSAGSIATARALSREYPHYTVPAVGLGVTIAAAQVPKCSHYITDVAAGLAIGLAAEAIVDRAWEQLATTA